MTGEQFTPASGGDCASLSMAESPLERAKEALMETGLLFYDFGWSLGTSSNYSILMSDSPFRLLLTASGKDKSRLEEEDFVLVDDLGQPAEPARGKPSAETMLHVMLARRPGVGAVLHTHSVWGTMLSEDQRGIGGLAIEGYEMLKGLAGVKTHEHREWVNIFNNSQDIPTLSGKVEEYLDKDDNWSKSHGFLIRRHGLYTWGKDIEEARRHVEIFEFLFEVIGRGR